MGAQGQIEQVFLNLLVHAEQYGSESPAKTICVSSSLIARRVMIEIGYSIPLNEQGAEIDPFEEGRSPDGAVGLGVCQGIIQSHGGEIRFRSGSGSDAIRMARFEIDLPIARETAHDPGPNVAHEARTAGPRSRPGADGAAGGSGLGRTAPVAGPVERTRASRGPGADGGSRGPDAAGSFRRGVLGRAAVGIGSQRLSGKNPRPCRFRSYW